MKKSSRFPTGKSASPPATRDEVTQSVCANVRDLRRKRGWTLEQLSAMCGVSRSMLSQIERGVANPTLGVAHRIAQAFRLTLGDLVNAPSRSSAIEVIREQDAGQVFRDDSQCRIRTLSPLPLEKDVEFYELTLRPGGALVSAAHFAGTREFLTVEKGVVRVTSGGDTRELRRGDSAHYAADLPHKIENIGRRDAIAFLVDIYH